MRSALRTIAVFIPAREPDYAVTTTVPLARLRQLHIRHFSAQPLARLRRPFELCRSRLAWRTHRIDPGGSHTVSTRRFSLPDPAECSQRLLRDNFLSKAPTVPLPVWTRPRQAHLIILGAHPCGHHFPGRRSLPTSRRSVTGLANLRSSILDSIEIMGVIPLPAAMRTMLLWSVSSK